jgi:hypothetical protein
MAGNYDVDEAAAIALQTMKAEAKTRAKDYPAYEADPKAETLRTFEIMASDEKFAEGYTKLLGDLVYGERPEFTSAFKAVQQFAERIRDA